MPEPRRQLSLYVPSDAAAAIEAVRRVVDPIQSGLIPAHVTLCREEELGRLSESELLERLTDPGLKPVTLRFGRPEGFSGHGILLPCIGGVGEFRSLRERLLGSTEIREQQPHITLAHPRNAKASGNSLTGAAGLPESLSITFSTVRLIEQEGGQPWKVLGTFELSDWSGGPMTDPYEVSLETATAADLPLLSNLLELYIHDLSAAFPGVELGPDGRFGYPQLGRYWAEPERRFPFLIRCGGRVAGFALVTRGSPATEDPEVFDVAELFVLRSYRRSGVGRRAAFLLWSRLPGRWIVRVSEGNPGAIPFWSGVIAEFARGAVTESTRPGSPHPWRVFSFTS
jgi:predicted acetyltransferase